MLELHAFATEEVAGLELDAILTTPVLANLLQSVHDQIRSAAGGSKGDDGAAFLDLEAEGSSERPQLIHGEARVDVLDSFQQHVLSLNVIGLLFLLSFSLNVIVSLLLLLIGNNCCSCVVPLLLHVLFQALVFGPGDA